jgi:hypothetical protein
MLLSRFSFRLTSDFRSFILRKQASSDHVLLLRLLTSSDI